MNHVEELKKLAYPSAEEGAQRAAELLADYLRQQTGCPDWKPEWHENCGWHWRATLPGLLLSPVVMSGRVLGYHCLIAEHSGPGHHKNTGYIGWSDHGLSCREFQDPVDALREHWETAAKHVNRLFLHVQKLGHQIFAKAREERCERCNHPHAYYSENADNFFCARCHRGKGNDFHYAEVKNRANYPPRSLSAEVEPLILGGPRPPSFPPGFLDAHPKDTVKPEDVL